MRAVIKSIFLSTCLFLSAPALSAMYMVMPQDGGTSMQAGLNKAEGNEGVRPEMPVDNSSISISLTAGILPDISINQHYNFPIPTDWTTVEGDKNLSLSEINYTLTPTDSNGLFSLNGNSITGTIGQKNTYLFDLFASYKGQRSNTVSLVLNADDWHIDSRGVVFCPGVPQGETKTLNGKKYTSAGTDKEFSATNYDRACTSNVEDMSWMPWPDKETFNGDISHWDTSSVITMDYMFVIAYEFNQPLENFNTGNVESMFAMFHQAFSFNQSLDVFDTSRVRNMAAMFNGARNFNKSLYNFDTRNVTDMNRMFDSAYSFNQSVENFNTDEVINTWRMFQDARAFNQPVSNFVTSKVKDMSYMFRSASSFNQNLSDWCVTNIITKPTGFDDSTANWNKINRQPVWGSCPNKQAHKN